MMAMKYNENDVVDEDDNETDSQDDADDNDYDDDDDRPIIADLASPCPLLAMAISQVRSISKAPRILGASNLFPFLESCSSQYYYIYPLHCKIKSVKGSCGHISSKFLCHLTPCPMTPIPSTSSICLFSRKARNGT